MGESGIGRRDFARALGGGLALGLGTAARSADLGTSGSLTDVSGVTVGHFTDGRRPTGCTVVVAEQGAVCGVDVRGGAPGTRETDLLDPVNTVQGVHAVLLAGGSAFGLDAASGVMRFLEERGIGVAVGGLRVPIVPAAILFDLTVGDGRIRPDAAAGYAAARAAAGGAVAEGSVGAGAGATVGKLLGRQQAMKGGIGTASLRLPGGLVVGALVAVNAVGDVRDPASGKLVAGARTADGRRLAGTMDALRAGRLSASSSPGQSTSIGVVATNAALGKAEATKVAQMAQDGLARTLEPAHTPWDGDTLFALAAATHRGHEDVLVIGALAADAVARAVVRAVLLARGAAGIPAASELSLSTR